MMPHAALMLVAVLANAPPGETPARSSAPAYLAGERAVDNWRRESAFGLELAYDADPAQAPRCVRLNNYWCVKRGGWVGEIAADEDGHVAFATAEQGAAVAAQLLRRYYVDFHRRSAREIVSRWAPSRCGLLAPLLATAPFAPGTGGQQVGQRRMLPQRVVSMGAAPRGLAVHGLANTLRARWLAAHGRAGFAAPHRPKRAKAGPRRSAVAAALPALERAPAIALGMGEPLRPRSETAPAAAPAPLDLCVPGESERLANYAQRAIAGVVASPDDDLVLFTPEGAPTANLAKVLANMAAVEIGPLRAREGLVAAGIARMTRQLAEAKDTAAAGR
jgi:hypothetical protein